MSDTPETDTAVLLVGHGSAARPAAIETLADHAAALAGRGRFRDVRHAALAGGPDPAEELGALTRGGPVLVLPMFMSDGQLVRNVVPGRLAAGEADRAHICPPVGLSPEIPRLCADIADRRRLEIALEDGAWDVIVAAHGSLKDPASRRATEWVAAELRAISSAATVTPAYIEEPPFIADTARDLTRPTVVVGLFAATGGHAADDVPRALAHAANVPVTYTGAIGADARIVDIVESILIGEHPHTFASDP